MVRVVPLSVKRIVVACGNDCCCCVDLKIVWSRTWAWRTVNKTPIYLSPNIFFYRGRGRGGGAVPIKFLFLHKLAWLFSSASVLCQSSKEHNSSLEWTSKRTFLQIKNPIISKCTFSPIKNSVTLQTSQTAIKLKINQMNKNIWYWQRAFHFDFKVNSAYVVKTSVTGDVISRATANHYYYLLLINELINDLAS